MVQISGALLALFTAAATTATNTKINNNLANDDTFPSHTAVAGDKTQSPLGMITSTSATNPLRTDHVVRAAPTSTSSEGPTTAAEVFNNVGHMMLPPCPSQNATWGCLHTPVKSNSTGSASAPRAWGAVGIAMAVGAGAVAFL
jgi:hypothetical protein